MMEYDNEFNEDNGKDIFFYMERSNVDGDESQFVLRVKGNEFLEGIEMGTEEERAENVRLLYRLQVMTDSLIEIIKEGDDLSGIIIIFEDKNACKSIRAWLCYFLWLVGISGYIRYRGLFSDVTFTFHTSISILECNDSDNGPCFIIYPDDIVDNKIIFFDDSKEYMIFDQNGWIDMYEMDNDNVSKLIKIIGG